MSTEAFDRDYPLAELLPASVLAAAGAALVERLRAAAAVLRQLLLARSRYLMAGSLHSEAVDADYAALQAKHALLLDSEARYRELSAQLEQRVAEQVKLIDERQLQLYQAEKLASVGQLAAGVAHEINNPIGFVRSNLSTFSDYLETFRSLKTRLAEGEAAWSALDLDFTLADGAELIADSIAGIDRVARIVRDLKGFSNIDGATEEFVDLNHNLEQVVAVLAGQLPEGVVLRFAGGKLPPLLCLPAHLNQVFLNVIRNAVQATVDAGHPGEVLITSRATATGIEVAVRDGGVGLTPEVAARAFEPFYTTRIVGQGTGLGLTVARDIVQAHEGHIALASVPGRGTVVTIHLPP